VRAGSLKKKGCFLADMFGRITTKSEGKNALGVIAVSPRNRVQRVITCTGARVIRLLWNR
jgi:hypothetical protein